MFITHSSLTLSSILFASGTILGNIHSATAYSFPGVLPLSTPLAAPHNQSSTLPSSYSYSPPGSRSPLPTEFPSTMPPSGEVVYPYQLHKLAVVVPSSESSPSVSVSLDSPAPTTTTSAGTSLIPSSAFSSNSDVSTSLTSRSAASGTTSISSLAISASPSSSLSTNSSFTSGFIFTSDPFPTTPTRTLSATVSSSHFTSPPSPSTHASIPSALSSTAAITGSSSDAADSTTTVVFSTTLTTAVGLPSSSLNSPSTSTYTITSVVLSQGGTTTDFVTTSSVLSTQSPGTTVDSTLPLSPGTIAAIVLGIVGALAFSALWLFCARRRHRELVRETAHIPPENHAPRPFDDEILDVEELGYGIGSTRSAENPMNQVMDERYAGILAALHSTEGFGRGNEGGSTGGVYGSRHDTATDMDGNEDIARASSPTLPLHVLPPDDLPYMVPLSPPPPVSQPSYHQTTQPALPPSSYYIASRRKSSPGPDAAAWLGGYSAAPSCYSYYTRSQTLGSGSGSGSVDALSRTRTGSEEPLLGIGKATPEVAAGVPTPGGISPTATTDLGGSRPGLGSAFGSPATSMYSPSSIYPALRHDTSGSYGTRSASGSGSYGYPRSATPSSFDVLGSVSSQGALSSVYSQGHGQSQGFRFFNRQGSSSSGSTGKMTGSNRQSFGVPPASFKAWRDRGSAVSDKEKRGEKQSLREKDRKPRPRSWTSAASAAGSVDEKQGRASPVVGVRAFLGRLRRAGHTPSPHSSNKDLPSPTKASMDVDPEKAVADRVTPPPIQIEAATPQRRQFSFILSNPDPHPSSLYSGVEGVMPSSGTPPHQEPRSTQYDMPTSDSNDSKPIGSPEPQPATPFPSRYVLGSAPSPVPTEESRLAEGLLHPRLQTQGHSDASLRDFEDYSRPIGGVVKNRLYSTTTFGTQDDADKSPSRGTPVQEVLPGDEHERENEAVDVFGGSTLPNVPRDSWFVDDLSSPTTARYSPVGS